MTSGLTTYVVGQIKGKLAVWRYIFLIYGSITVALGVAVFLLLPDNPSKAWFLNVGHASDRYG